MEAESRRRHRILLAEDDDPLRRMLQKALTAAGFDVEAVADGDAAQDAYIRSCPDLLLADLVMPGLNGQQLASACHDHCPDTVMVFMSGYSEEELQDLEIRQVVFIPKPIATSDLVQTLTTLLRRREESGR